jgi:oligoendopeptidase F
MQNSIKYFLIFLLIFWGSKISAQKVYENRDEIPAEYKWNLNDIYKSWNEWENGLKDLETKMDEVTKYKGKLKDGPEVLLKVQKLSDELGVLSCL